MYIIIAGGGMVGRGLARRLLENKHDVVVVEPDRAVCEDLNARIGVMTVHGSATNIDVLDQAGIEKADVACAATPSDAVNLAFAVLAKNAGVPRIIARMRDPRYEKAYELAGAARQVHVGDLFVRQLALEIEQPSLRNVATFGRGRASIVVATVPENAVVDGKTVQEIAEDSQFPGECVIAGIFRKKEEEFIFPRGQINVRSGDQVFLAADTDQIRKAAQFLQATK